MSRNITLSVPKPRGGVFTPLGLVPGVHTIFVGAAACTRHRAFEMQQMVSSGRMSVLCLDEIDFITGSYIEKMKDAVRGLYSQYGYSGFIIIPNCQSALLSTDYSMITNELTDELGIPVKVREGCHICGFEVETDTDNSGTTEQLLFSFINPQKPDNELNVNIIAMTPLAEDNELFPLLKKAGVERINTLFNSSSMDEYQRMGSAHLNILCGDSGDSFGKALEDSLGIPYVVLSDTLDPEELGRRYSRIGAILRREIDVSEYVEKSSARFKAIKDRLQDVTVDVQGSPETAKWLIEEGINVGTLSLNPHAQLNSDLSMWFKKNAPQVAFGVGRGGHGGTGGHNRGQAAGRPDWHGNHSGGHGGPNEGQGQGWHGGHGGRPGTGELSVGFKALNSILNYLEETVGGVL